MSAKFILFVSLLTCLFSISVNVEASNNLDPNLANNSNPFDPPFTLNSDSDNEFLKLPLKPERHYIIQATLDELGASADEPLMKNMMELTLGYEKITIENLVIDIVKESKTNSIDREICIKKLAKAIYKYDKKHIADSKINRLAEIILDNFPSAQDGDKPKSPPKLLKNETLKGIAYGTVGTLGIGAIIILYKKTLDNGKK